MYRHGRLIIGWLCVAAVAGCAGGDLTLMQQELRDKEAAARESRDELEAVRFQLEAAQRENRALRAQLEGAGVETLTADYAAAMFTVKEVAFHRLSGGVDTDGFEGDDALLVFLQPLDNEGDLRKAPGKVSIELFDMAQEQAHRRIGYWEFDVQETHEHWYGGFLMSGYRFELPWQQGYPRHADLTVHARFETPDGRVFAKTRQIRLRLLPGGDSNFLRTARPPQSPLPDQAQAEPRTGSQPADVQSGDSQTAPAAPTLFAQPDA